ncbi:MAG: helix-turn-helix transcriptional regulator [Bacteroidaceae bacterium]|nr:helix-turn-helix transcriptional regulator [Bacteroidaceae bacterium]
MKIFQPRVELRQYVRYYWLLKSREPFCTQTFPIGCCQIIFHRKSPLYIPELDSRQYRLTISGQVNFPARIASDGDTDMVVVVFYPHVIGLFLDTPPSEFYNMEISGSDIGDVPLNELAMKVLDCGNDACCVKMIEAWLMSKVRTSLNVDRVGATVNLLMHNPSMPVVHLADAACLGKKQFERVFRESVGMNPKEYARIVRFQKSLWMLQKGCRHYAAIAYDCGYADQSHFIREFKSLSGYSPRALLKHCAPYSDLFSTPA